MAFRNIPPNGFPDVPDMEEVEAVGKDVTTLKTSVAGLTSDVTNLNSNKANQITIAPFFNDEASYDPGDLVYYNGLSYRCVNAHEGEWDADDFAETTIADELDTLKSGLTSVTEQANKTVYQNTDRLVCFSSVEGAIIIMCHNPTLGKSIGISIGLDGTIARYETADV